jgi:hypothetical protein
LKSLYFQSLTFSSSEILQKLLDVIFAQAARRHVLVPQLRPRLISEADVQGAGVEIDAARMFMLVGLESHRRILLGGENWGTATLPLHMAEEEAWMSINRHQPDRGPRAALSERERTHLGRSG